MKKIFLILAMILIMTLPVLAGTSYESITVADTAIGLTTTKITDYTTLVICTLETAQIRFRVDGTNPISTEGHILDVGKTLELPVIDDIKKFKAIRTGASSGVLKCTYY